ncbi:hypothetical protein FQR65_LT03312 [Abscondita terminalis]|nr:hypothetical protein FQR65_LT03312 [Abscondita terminalis]
MTTQSHGMNIRDCGVWSPHSISCINYLPEDIYGSSGSCNPTRGSGFPCVVTAGQLRALSGGRRPGTRPNGRPRVGSQGEAQFLPLQSHRGVLQAAIDARPEGCACNGGAGGFQQPQSFHPHYNTTEYKSVARVRVVFKATRGPFSLVC